MSEHRTRNVAVLLFQKAELLDFAGPYEAYTAASNNQERVFNTFSVAETQEKILSNNGMPVVPEYTLENCPPVDILVVPGGQGTRTEVDNPVIIDWIQKVAADAELVTSVCTGSFLLARAGLLDGKSVTTHWGSIQRMREQYPELDVQEQVRYVDAGQIVTSAGVSAGIDMSLYVIERLCGTEIAGSSARLMEYDYWQPVSVG